LRVQDGSISKRYRGGFCSPPSQTTGS